MDRQPSIFVTRQRTVVRSGTCARPGILAYTEDGGTRGRGPAGTTPGGDLRATGSPASFGNDRDQYYETIGSGSGAGDGFPGTSVVQTHMTNSC